MGAIHDAARSGDLNAVKRIVESSNNAIDRPDSGLGWTALHTAVIRGRTEIVQYLVEQGADVDRGNNNFLTPLVSAVSNHRKFEIIYALVVDGGANVLRLSNSGKTVLEIAQQFKCNEAIMNLLRTHVEKAEAEKAAKKEAEKKKRAEAAAKRKAEREANGGKAPKKKKGKKAAAKKKSPTSTTTSKNVQEEQEGREEDPKPANSNQDLSVENHPLEQSANQKREENKESDVEQNDKSNNDDSGGENGSENNNNESEDNRNEPRPFLQADNQEVIGATKLMLVNDMIVVREQSVVTQQQQEERDEKEIKVLEAAAKLTKQLQSWSPDDEVFAFYIPPNEVQVGSEVLEEKINNASDNGSIQGKPRSGAILAHGLLNVNDDGDRMEVEIKKVQHDRKTAWSSRYYYSGGRIQSKVLSKIKAATNILKAQTLKSTISEIKFYTEDRAWYWPTILLVGDCKKVPGALFGVKFDCIDQEHHHHGR